MRLVDRHGGRLVVLSGNEGSSITPSVLRHTAVVVRSGAGPSFETSWLLKKIVPWWTFWPMAKKSFSNGIWRCVVGLGGGPYGGNRASRLSFHNDMTAYDRPPEFVAIRMIEADSAGGGANRLLHLDDVLHLLRHEGRQELLHMVTRSRRLNLRDGTNGHGALLVEGDAAAPSRVFDPGSATKGLHADLGDDEIGLLVEFLTWCEGAESLLVEVRL